MGDTAKDLVGAIERAASELASAVAGADPRWLVLGVLLHLANQLARGRGWCSVLRTACPADGVRVRDTLAAWVAGAGASGLLSARGGDAVRLLLMRPRTPGAGYPVLAGTLAAEAAGEAAVGIALLAVALSVGLGPVLPVMLAQTGGRALPFAPASAAAGVAIVAAGFGSATGTAPDPTQLAAFF